MNAMIDALETWEADDARRIGFRWEVGDHAVLVTLENLGRRSRRAAQLIGSSTRPGDRVAILLPQSVDYLAALLGCWYAGCIAVPIYPKRRRADARLDAVLADSGAAIGVVVGDLGDAGLLEHSQGRLGLISIGLGDDAADADGAFDRRGRDDSVAVLQYTSGSTGRPKGVRVTAANLADNVSRINGRFGHSRSSVGVVWLPPYHDMGLVGGLLAPLVGGFEVTLLDAAAVSRNPARWLECIGARRATTSGGPDFAYDLCSRSVSDERLASIDLSSWAVAFSGAEPVRAATMRSFAARFAACGFRPSAFTPCYGLAEATLMVAGGEPGRAPTIRTIERTALADGLAFGAPTGAEVVGCGAPIDGHAVVIVEPTSGLAVEPGVIGEVWVAGPSVADGYHSAGGDSPTSFTFDARLGDRPEPFLRTGDLGFFADGELFITGRARDLIIVRGQNHHPEDLEETSRAAHGDLAGGAAAAFTLSSLAQPEHQEPGVVVVQELGRRRRPHELTGIAAGVRRAVAATHGVRVDVVVLVPFGQLPRTSSGKIQRAAVRELFASNGLNELCRSEADLAASPPPPSIDARDLDPAGALDHVRHIAAHVGGLPLEACHGDASMQALGLDSLAVLRALTVLEDTTGVSIGVSDVYDGATLRDLARIIWSHARSATGRTPSQPMNVEPEGRRRPSAAELSMWLQHRLAPHSSALNLSGALRITPPFELDRLQAAVESVWRRHPALRSRFVVDHSGHPLVANDLSGPTVLVDDHDSSGWDAATRTDRRQRAIVRPFDLEQGPLVRVVTFTSEVDQELLLVCHHAVGDLASLERVIADLDAELAGGARANRLLASTTPVIRSETMPSERSRSYWRETLTPPLPVLALPPDRVRPPVRSFSGSSHQFELPLVMSARVRAASRQMGTTPFVVLLATFAAALDRFDRGGELVVGTPVAAPYGADGLTANTVALRLDVRGTKSFAELVQRTRRVVASALAHADVPIADVVADLRLERDASRNPIYQAMFVMQSPSWRSRELTAPLALGHGGHRSRFGGHDAETLVVDRDGSVLDLTAMVAATSTGFGVTLTFDAVLFDLETIIGLAETWCSIIDSATAEAHGSPPVAGWHEPASPLLPATPRETSVIDEILHQAANAPTGTAITYGANCVTWSELIGAATELRHRLPPRVGVGSVVGVAVTDPAMAVAAMLGVAFSGAAFLPLPLDAPAAYTGAVLGRACVEAVVTDASTLSLVEAPTLAVDAVAPTRSSRSLVLERADGSLLCAFSTSGSTGRPRVVGMTDLAVSHQTALMAELLGVGKDDVTLILEPMASSSMLRQVLGTLRSGGRLHWCSAPATDVEATFATIEAAGVTLVSVTPSILRHWIDALEGRPHLADALSSLRVVSAASETLHADLAMRWRRVAPERTRLVNLFGHTEACGIVTAHWTSDDAPGAATVPIGRPLEPGSVAVLDADLAPVRAGGVGEVYIAGPALSWGYIGEPAATALHFLPHPTRPGERMHATNDVAIVRRGELVHLGRRDDQFKVRGHRLDPAEIESWIDRQPGVQSSVASVVDGRLVAHVILTPDAPTPVELRRMLADVVPPHLVPSRLIAIADWPTTSTGKVDRRRLPAPDHVRDAAVGELVVPRTADEERLREIWTRVLGIDDVGVEDAFFDLGGTSLDAAAVQHLIHVEMGADISLIELFQRPTIAAIARAVTSASATESAHMSRALRSADRRRAMMHRVAASRRNGKSQGGRETHGPR